MKYKQLFLVAATLLFAIICKAQSSSNNAIAEYNGNQLAEKLAKKMKDSLDLTGQQKQQLKDVNKQLHNSKMALRNQYSGQDSVLTIKIRQVENTRDSLYRPILGEQKFLLYRQKKINLLQMN
ncbi:MAG: hypothetical protein K2W79_12545 [Hydrotalea flava]|nr:hypothetical protein [Hydrotalea flava]